MTIKSSLSSTTAAPKAATTGGVAAYSYRALQAQNDIYLSTPTSTLHSNNDALNTTTPHLQYQHRILPTTATHKTVKRKDHTAGELQQRLATTQRRLATNKTQTTTKNNKKTTKTTSQQSIEAELCKTLQISWIDARDLASFARGKLNIIPGDKSQEKTRRESILRVGIEADKAAPRKRVLSKPKKKLTKEEETIQRLKKAENNALIRWDIRDSRHYISF